MKRKALEPPRAPSRMRTAFALLALAALVAGCTASGETDPWAYTKKPLYASGFQLDRIAGGEDAQQFQVTDGSIASIRMQVWINATQGGGTLTIRDPGGRVVLETTETTERQTTLNLGQWTIHAAGLPGSAGTIHVLVTRG